MTFLYILLCLVLLVFIMAQVAPKIYEVSRSVTINKSAQEVFTYLKYLKNQNEWSVWAKKDPNMKKEFVGTDGQVGFISKWEGGKGVGGGEQEIVGITEGKRIDTHLRFLKPFKSTSDAFMMVKPIAPAKTEVIWGFKGKNTFPMSIFTMITSMDKMIGKDFEEGLSSLKTKLES